MPAQKGGERGGAARKGGLTLRDEDALVDVRQRARQEGAELDEVVDRDALLLYLLL